MGTKGKGIDAALLVDALRWRGVLAHHEWGGWVSISIATGSVAIDGPEWDAGRVDDRDGNPTDEVIEVDGTTVSELANAWAAALKGRV